MKHSLSFILIISLFVLSKIAGKNFMPCGDLTTASIGLLLLSSFIISKLNEKIKLPKLSSYIITGILLGPFVLNIISQSSLNSIMFVNSIALAFIAFTAGGELRFDKLKQESKSISFVIIFTIIIVFTVVFFGALLLSSFSNELRQYDLKNKIVISIIIGTIALAHSPSSVIAIINETKSKGFYPDIVLSVSIALDVLLILLFALTVATGKSICLGNKIDFAFIISLSIQTISALIAGFFVGFIITLLVKFLHADLPVLIILLGIFVTRGMEYFSYLIETAYSITVYVEPLIICIAAGFWVSNFTNYGEKFLKSMNKVSLPIYALFFTIAGATINLNILRTCIIYGLILFIIRTSATYTATSLAFINLKASKESVKYGWMGFVTQAGISIGLANEIAHIFPLWGKYVSSILIAIISLNQLIGPVLFKIALGKIKE